MFTLATPWILLLLPSPWLIWRLLPAAQTKHTALKVPFYQNIQPNADMHKQQRHYSHTWLHYCIWILLLLAAAGPQWLGKAIPIAHTGRDIMLAIDLSGSMELPDMTLNNQRINRLQAIKALASEFIKQRSGDRIGLIIFGSNAYLQTPLTFDLQTVLDMLNDTSIGLAGTQTAIGDAIGLAIKRLLQRPQANRVLILLTDGANNSGITTPLTAAKLAAKHNIKIHSIGFGADNVTLQRLFGPRILNASMQLDEITLKQIAQLTQGQYFRAKDTNGLRKVYQQLNKLEPLSKEDAIYQPTKPLYPWPLVMALLISLYIAIWHILPKRIK